MRVTYSYAKASSYDIREFVRLIMVIYLSIQYNVVFGFFYLLLNFLFLLKTNHCVMF